MACSWGTSVPLGLTPGVLLKPCIVNLQFGYLRVVVNYFVFAVVLFLLFWYFIVFFFLHQLPHVSDGAPMLIRTLSIPVTGPLQHKISFK